MTRVLLRVCDPVKKINNVQTRLLIKSSARIIIHSNNIIHITLKGIFFEKKT